MKLFMFFKASDRVVRVLGESAHGDDVLIIKNTVPGEPYPQGLPRGKEAARMVMQVLSNLSGDIFYELAELVMQKLDRLVQLEMCANDMFEWSDTFSNYTHRHRIAFARVLRLDPEIEWSDIAKELGLKEGAMYAEMKDALRRVIANELSADEEYRYPIEDDSMHWLDVWRKLGFEKDQPIPSLIEIIEALRRRRAIQKGLPENASWAYVNK